MLDVFTQLICENQIVGIAPGFTSLTCHDRLTLILVFQGLDGLVRQGNNAGLVALRNGVLIAAVTVPQVLKLPFDCYHFSLDVTVRPLKPQQLALAKTGE